MVTLLVLILVLLIVMVASAAYQQWQWHYFLTRWNRSVMRLESLIVAYSPQTAVYPADVSEGSFQRLQTVLGQHTQTIVAQTNGLPIADLIEEVHRLETMVGRHTETIIAQIPHSAALSTRVAKSPMVHIELKDPDERETDYAGDIPQGSRGNLLVVGEKRYRAVRQDGTTHVYRRELT